MTAPRPAPAPPLDRNQVHVWSIRLPQNGTEPTSLIDLLTEDERLRAARFHFDIHRTEYIQAHGVLRVLLARYLGQPRETRSFLMGAHGKPSLVSGERLRFNLGHSRERALVAFADGIEVGVDLERIKDDFPVQEVAHRYFSGAEREAIAALPPVRQRAGFFHVWCQKEAYLKGRGDGVTLGLDHFDVAADPAEPAALLADRRDPSAVSRWRLHTLDAGPEYRAALAVECDEVEVRCFEWEPRELLSP